MAAVGPAIAVLLLMGVPGLLTFRYAERIARWQEQADAIGSTRDLSEVEPAAWKVLLEKLLGLVLLAGSLVLAGMLLVAAD